MTRLTRPLCVTLAGNSRSSVHSPKSTLTSLSPGTDPSLNPRPKDLQAPLLRQGVDVPLTSPCVTHFDPMVLPTLGSLICVKVMTLALYFTSVRSSLPFVPTQRSGPEEGISRSRIFRSRPIFHLSHRLTGDDTGTFDRRRPSVRLIRWCLPQS